MEVPEIPVIFSSRSARSAVKRQVATAMKVPLRQVNRLKLCEKPLESVQKREKKARKAAEHREKCRDLAKSVLMNAISRTNAAIAAGISERQMARYMAAASKELQCLNQTTNL
jgi:hypothetical protein